MSAEAFVELELSLGRCRGRRSVRQVLRWHTERSAR